MTGEPKRPVERFVRLAASIRGDIAAVGRVVEEARAAAADFAEREPPLRELRGIGDIVHDFYTGIERVFEKVAPELNGGVPAGAAWHRELLRNMTLDLPGVRPPVLAVGTARALEEFLRFRHLFRNVYGFELDWARLPALLPRVPVVWDATREDLDRFLSFLDAAGRAAT
jgi:hypothetical protein